MSRIPKITAVLFLMAYSVGCIITPKSIEVRLGLAACEGRVDVVKALVKVTVNINARSSFGDTPLIATEACGKKEESAAEIVRILIDNGADVNLKGQRGMTVLMYAAGRGHPQVVRQLLAKSAAVNVTDNSGETALMYAVSSGCNVEVLKTLIEAGADVNARNNKGQSVLDVAKASKACPYSRMIQVLIENGAK